MQPNVHFELKPLSPEGIPAALERATRYRLLNEPAEAESICQDILRLEPENQSACVTLLLALTDRFGERGAHGVTQAEEVLQRLQSDYDRLYYAGIILERRAKARFGHGLPGAGHDAFEWLREAMDFYERAEAVRPEGNDDALLRWNACARLIMKEHLAPRPDENYEPALE